MPLNQFAWILSIYKHKGKHMKTLILAAFFIIFGLASCTVTEPNDGYYSQQRVYNDGYSNDSYYSPVYDSRYSIQRVYDYRTGRYYDVAVYNQPVYGVPVYQDGYRRQYRRDNYRNDGYRREYRQQQPRYEQPQQSQPSAQPQERRLPDGTRISSDGTVTLPNGQVRGKR